MRPLEKDDVIIHTHVPATAGNTTRTLLEMHLPIGSVLFIGQRPDQGFTIEHCAAHLTRKRRIQERMVRPDNPRPFRAVTGHIQYGWHYLADIPRDRARYVIVLRDPVQRMMSIYHKAKRDPQGWALPRGTSITAEEFFQLDHLQEMRNGMCKRICGRADAEEAFRGLKNYDLVGLQHSYMRFARRLALMIGSKFPMYYDVGVGAGPEFRYSVSWKIRSLIMEANAEDVELFSMAVDEFRSMIILHDVPVFRESARWVLRYPIMVTHRVRRALGKLKPAVAL